MLRPLGGIKFNVFINPLHTTLLETLSLLKPRYLVQPFNVIKWQLKFNPAG
jgi:hypothetical protein